MAYKKRRYTAKRKSYSKPSKRKSTRARKAAPRAQTLVIKIVGGGNGVATSTATLGKKAGRPVYARF